MTKKELLEAIKDMPDDALLFAHDAEEGIYEIGSVKCKPMHWAKTYPHEDDSRLSWMDDPRNRIVYRTRAGIFLGW